jgi:hypothetical protein
MTEDKEQTGNIVLSGTGTGWNDHSEGAMTL